MQAQGQAAPPGGLSLENAVSSLLDAPATISGGPDLEQRLEAVQAACTGLVALVEGGGSLSTNLLETALEAVARGLAAVRVHVEAAAGQLAALRATAWCEAALAAADAVMHSEAWHAAWHVDAAAGGAAGYQRSVAAARDLVKNDLAPLLCEAAAQLTPATGFCLAPQFKALLDMGRTAAEIVGLRDARHRRPGLRNFSVLNALWNGIQRAWTSVPPGVCADMERQGLGVAEMVGAVAAAARLDIRACHRLLEPGVGKLLLYWLQKARFVLVAHPSAAPACWAGLLELPLCCFAELGLLAAAAGGGGTAAQLADALREQVLPKAVALLATCLSATTAEDQLRVMLDGLRMKLAAGEQAAAAGPVHALRTVLHLLQAAPSLHPLARSHCVALLAAVLDALPGAACAAALQSAELREEVGDGVLAFLAACCHSAAVVASQDAAPAWERQLVAQTWERCQQQLFLAAMQPHPLTAAVLGGVWADLAGASSEALVKAHLSALRELLQLAAAAAAAAGGHSPPTPLYSQLLGLLAGLLAAAPPHVADAYFGNFLQVLPAAHDDACQLSCLAAELRLATLVDTASGGTAAAPQVHAVLRDLYSRFMEVAPLVAKRTCSGGGGGSSGGEAAAGEAGAAYLAWLLDALRCGVAYVASTGARQGAGADALDALPSRLVTVLDWGAWGEAQPFVAPALAALRDLDTASLPAPALEALARCLAAFQQRPELAAAAAAVAPALAACPAPHSHVVQAALEGGSPLLQHLGMEAFRRYAQACPAASLVTQALPPSMLKPGTSLMLDEHTAVLAQYSQRCPAGGASRVQERELADWAAALRQEALGAAAALRRAVAEARRAQAAAAAAGGAGSSGGEGGLKPGSRDGSAAAAVAAVQAAVQAAEAALRQGAAGLDGASVRELQSCSERLSALLAGPMAGAG